MNVNKADKNWLDTKWNNANWKALEDRLFEMQKCIALATKARDFNSVRMYQKRLTQNLGAKMLAVRHVSENCSTPGIDGVCWLLPSDRMFAALSLSDVGYHALPMKLVIIKSNFTQKERHIKIPTYYDRAMQTLHAYSLLPVSETMADKRSFAFRRNRSTQDTHVNIIEALKRGASYIIKTDVKSCYASISHDWLLSNIPMNTEVLYQFLKAGHVFAGDFFPSEDSGISLGVSISPILGNMTLDGMQDAIFESLHGIKYNENYCDGYLVRFADDIFVTAETKIRAQRILNIIERFLHQRGMRLSETKTEILNACQGFDFLSRHYMKNGNAVYSRPSDTAILKMESDLKEMILQFSGSQKSLIDKLNKKLHGWATYHRISNARKAFRYIDVFVRCLLLKLCHQMHPRWTRQKILDYYFFLNHRGEHVYALHDKKDVQVVSLVDTVLIEHIPQKVSNQFLESKKQHIEEQKIHNVVGKYKAIWEHQKGKCYFCGHYILQDQKRILVQKYYSKTRRIKNLAYVHENCISHECEFIHTSDIEYNHESIENLLNNFRGNQRRQKFSKLHEYFLTETRYTFTLHFKEISKIAEINLCKSAYTSNGYWLQNSYGTIGYSWSSNGYKIKKLDIKKEKISFVRDKKYMPISIPEIFMNGRIPENAKTELENFFDYIIKKYAL